jgi:hypothetical protein
MGKFPGRTYEAELADLTETVLSGQYIYDRVLSERIVRVLCAVADMTVAHPLDRLGRCGTCRRSRRWHRRPPCSPR